MSLNVAPRRQARASFRPFKTVLCATLVACAASVATASAMPKMGFVGVTVFKHPEEGCPASVDLFVSSYATGWPDGDTVDHKVTYQVERKRTSGAIVKYKVLEGAYKPLTQQNGDQTTELDTQDDDHSFGFTMDRNFTNSIKLIVLKPFHFESPWQAFSVGCIS